MERGLTTTAATAPPGDDPRAPPDTPRYRFEAFLARGGMGQVWRGFDTVLAREVAPKVLREWVFADDGLRSRFEEEARHVGRLEHPSIVSVHDLGELPDGRPFFVMKLIHGQTLAELLAARATLADDLARRVGVFEQVCAAVAFAHARDLIHRDLKPSNFMLGEFGEVLVMDLGIAKILVRNSHPAPAQPIAPPPVVGRPMRGSEASETLSGQAKGTPAFMGPEPARGEASRIGKVSDVFGLGGILRVMLTGRPPFIRALEVPAGDVAEAFARLEGCGADAGESRSSAENITWSWSREKHKGGDFDEGTDEGTDEAMLLTSRMEFKYLASAETRTRIESVSGASVSLRRYGEEVRWKLEASSATTLTMRPGSERERKFPPNTKSREDSGTGRVLRPARP